MAINTIDQLMISGNHTYVIPFEIEHARSEEYLEWMRDYDVIKTLNLLSYVEKPVSKKELETYCKMMNTDKTILFFALYYKKYDQFIGTVKISYYNETFKETGIQTDYEVTLHEAWPKSISAIELGWENAELADFEIEIQYSWWTGKSGGVSYSSGSTGTNNTSSNFLNESGGIQ